MQLRLQYEPTFSWSLDLGLSCTQRHPEIRQPCRCCSWSYWQQFFSELSSLPHDSCPSCLHCWVLASARQLCPGISVSSLESIERWWNLYHRYGLVRSADHSDNAALEWNLDFFRWRNLAQQQHKSHNDVLARGPLLRRYYWAKYRTWRFQTWSTYSRKKLCIPTAGHFGSDDFNSFVPFLKQPIGNSSDRCFRYLLTSIVSPRSKSVHLLRTGTFHMSWLCSWLNCKRCWQ